MKITHESRTPALLEHNASGPGHEGKSLMPPAFQLQSSNPQSGGQVASPIQAKFAKEEEEGPLQRKEDVSQLYDPEADHGMCVEGGSLADEQWEHFANDFNREFKSILHIFPAAAPACGDGSSPESADTAAGSPTYSKMGEASGAILTGAQLKALFTASQRDKLTDFMTSRNIPERLFNGDEIGKTTAQQRILMAAHILSTGKYQPGSFEQRVHARMCWHWVHITHHYAGATPSGGLNQGMMGMFDHDNNVVLGSGKLESIFHGKGTKPKDLPKEYDPEKHLGPIPEGSAHKEAADKEQKKLEENPEAKGSIKMLETLPFDQFDKIKPGDWLWYYNANGSGIGSHSVIFSRWASDTLEEGGVRYRKAICFSQGRPESGGREHNANLGERFFKNDKVQISPVNYITRVSEDTNPAQTVDELLPKGSEKKEAALHTGNEKYIAQVEKKYKRPVDRAKLMDLLRTENAGHIGHLSEQLTEGQEQLLSDANASDNLETLVRLTQRLRAIRNNSDIVLRNQEATNEKKGKEYEDTKAKVDAAEAKIDAEVAKLDAEKADLEKKVLDMTTEKDELDTAPEVKSKKGEFDKLDREIKGIEKKHKKDPDFLKTDEEFLKKKATRDALSTEIKSLKATGSSNKKEIEKLKAEIAKLKKKLTSNGWSRTAQEKKRAQAKKTLPYSLVHPGSWKGDVKGGTTGKLEDVLKAAQFEPALGEGTLPEPEVKKKSTKKATK